MRGLRKSERVIPVRSRVGGAAGFASVRVRTRQHAGQGQSLDAAGSVASSQEQHLLQEQCLLFPGQLGLLGALAASVLHFQSKWGCCKLGLSLGMSWAVPWCVLLAFVSLITSGFVTGLAPSPLL